MVGTSSIMDNHRPKSDGIKRGLPWSSSLESSTPPTKLTRTPLAAGSTLASPNLANPLLLSSSLSLFPTASTKTSSGLQQLTSTSTSPQLIASKRSELIERAQSQRQRLALSSSLLANSSLRKENRLLASSLTTNKQLLSSSSSSSLSSGPRLKSSLLSSSLLTTKTQPGGGTSLISSHATSVEKKTICSASPADDVVGKENAAVAVAVGPAVLGPNYDHLFQDGSSGLNRNKSRAEDCSKGRSQAGKEAEKAEKARKKIQELKVSCRHLTLGT